MDTNARRSFLKTLGAVGAAVAVPHVARAATTTTLKLTFPDTRNHPFYEIGKQFAANVKDKTAGAIDIRVFSAGELGSETNILTGMQTGIVDLCAHTSGFLGNVIPEVQGLNLPFLFDTDAGAEKVLDGPIGDRIFAAMPAKQIYGLCWGSWGWRVTETVENPVAEPADMKGLHIRIQSGAIFSDTFKTLGATPVAMDITEVYLGLSQKVIDAVEVPVISLAAGKNYEVVKCVTETNHTYNAGPLMISKRKMDSLPAAQQKAIRDAAKELSPAWRQAIRDKTKESAAFLGTQGVKMHKADIAAYTKATQPVYSEFRNAIHPDFFDALVKAANAVRA